MVFSLFVPTIINCSELLDTVKFSAFDIDVILSKLKTSLSSGTDGLPPILFKQEALLFQRDRALHCQLKSCNYKTSHLKILSCGIICVILRLAVLILYTGM